MVPIMLTLSVAAMLFIMAFASRRRFGVLGLGLTAGALLSATWTSVLTPFIEGQGISLSFPPLALIVQTLLILGPPLILLFTGPIYTVMWQRVLGALAFAVFGLAFMFSPLSTLVQLSGGGASIAFLQPYIQYVIAVGVILAIIDMLFAGFGKSKKHGH